MAKDRAERKAAKRGRKAEKRAAGAHGGKGLRKAQKAYDALEAEIDREFDLLTDDGFDRAELESLRWDYRYEKLEGSKLSEELLRYFVAKSEAEAAGLPAPPPPAEAAAAGPAGAAAGTAPPPAGGEYKRKSDVDLALVEKYLDRRISRDTTSELETIYKQAFGEDLVIPERLDLVDLSYRTSDILDAHASTKLSKAEILGVPEEAKPAEGAKAEAAPAVKRESRALATLLAARRGVPEGPTYDEKWSVFNPGRFWVLPKRWAGKNVATYYGLLALNFVVLIGQFALFLVPFLLRCLVFGLMLLRRLLQRFVAPKVSPAMGAKLKSFAKKMQSAPEAEKKPSTKPSG